VFVQGRGRLGTVDLLIKAACFVTLENSKRLSLDRVPPLLMHLSLRVSLQGAPLAVCSNSLSDIRLRVGTLMCSTWVVTLTNKY
jgi:hypothetical protein